MTRDDSYPQAMSDFDPDDHYDDIEWDDVDGTPPEMRGATQARYYAGVALAVLGICALVFGGFVLAVWGAIEALRWMGMR